MSKTKGLDQECFDRLLDFLGPDRDSAAMHYEAIRKRLIQIFAHRGCVDPGELADLTFDRVCGKIQEVGPDYEGDPARYFYGVANRIYLESFRKRPRPGLLPIETDPDIEIRYKCLGECMAALPREDQQLLIDYYTGKWKEQVARRKQLAKERGASIQALRLRLYRLRADLYERITSCMDRDRIR